MRIGSGGVLYALLRYNKFLRDTNRLSKDALQRLEFSVLEKQLDDAIKTTFQTLKEVKPDEEEKTAAFLESEHLGMSTLAVLHLIDRRKCKKEKEINKKLIKAVIVERILNKSIPKLETCDSSLFSGVAGYLYSLLVLEKACREYQEEEEAVDLL